MNIKKSAPSDLDLFSDEVSLLDLFHVLREFYKTIIAVTFTLGIASAAYSLVLTPIYEVNLSMIPTEKNSSSQMQGALSGFGGLASFAGIDLPQSYDGVDTSLAVMQSRVFLEGFIKSNNILQRLYPDDWDESSGEWAVEPKMWSAVNLFRSMLTVKQNVTTGVIEASLKWEDPNEAAFWLNQLIKEINLHLQSEVIEEGNINLIYLQEQLGDTKLASIENVIYGLIGEQTKEIMLAKVNKEYGFKVLDPAVVPLERISPRRTVITILGTIIGFIVGIAYAFSNRFYKNLKIVNSSTN